MLAEAKSNLHLSNGTLKKLCLHVFSNMTTKFYISVKGNHGVTMAGRAVEPHILIGTDYCWELTDLGLKRMNDGLFVFPMKIGKTLTARQVLNQKEGATTNNAVACYSISSASERFWGLETLGIKEPSKSGDDDQAMKQFYQTLNFQNHRYVVSWPYKGFKHQVPSNYQLCYFRLISVVNRLMREHLLEKYDDII
ncbi:unnamed protein product [Enterobius vermicularis]|uniref:DUF1758 domain-containing protein n=1 Tax=Enterobius vermicularis TaxID=51028 RepID=A0A0N4V3C8_ENTVE|nr:unnamed protein product [Enterobius vermicularis]